MAYLFFTNGTINRVAKDDNEKASFLNSIFKDRDDVIEKTITEQEFEDYENGNLRIQLENNELVKTPLTFDSENLFYSSPKMADERLKNMIAAVKSYVVNHPNDQKWSNYLNNLNKVYITGAQEKDPEPSDIVLTGPFEKSITKSLKDLNIEAYCLERIPR